MAKSSVEPASVKSKQGRLLRTVAGIVTVLLQGAVVQGVVVQAALAQTGAKPERIMNREELRVCLRENDTLKASNAELERNRKDLDAEKVGLVKDRDVLDQDMKAVGAQRSAVDVSDAAAVKAYNDKVEAALANHKAKGAELDAKIDAWNGRNRTHNERAIAHEQSMKTYNDGCASRRFREDDEKAIRAGK